MAYGDHLTDIERRYDAMGTDALIDLYRETWIQHEGRAGLSSEAVAAIERVLERRECSLPVMDGERLRIPAIAGSWDDSFFGKGLTELSLEGFQVFDKLTRIPLGRLTFLFGPNSAGKSAVEDAIRLLDAVLSDKNVPNLPEERGQWFRPHWRRGSTDGNEPAERMSLYATANVLANIGARLASLSEGASYEVDMQNLEIHSVEIRLKYVNAARRRPEDPILAKQVLELFLDGVGIVQVADYQSMGLNVFHPLLKSLKVGNHLNTKLQNDSISESSGERWLWHANKGIRLTSQLTVDSNYYLKVNSSRSDRSTENRRVADGFADFAEVVDLIIDTIVKAFDRMYDIVPASRTIPSRQDLRFLIHPNEYGLEKGAAARQDVDIAIEGDIAFRRLACGFIDPNSAERAIVDSVNHIFSSVLFQERGYKLKAVLRQLIEVGGTSSENSSHLGDDSEDVVYPVLVQMELVDSTGRTFDFDQVGSGLGYVLPVLASICDPGLSAVVLQQPELHLHPSLQASLGDALSLSVAGIREIENPLIRSRRRWPQLIVESHSELLLLRILKKIRLSHEGQLPPSESIHHDDVKILYFDPDPSGATNVKVLRVSEDGDFIDRWPRGFFSERDQELFDE